MKAITQHMNMKTLGFCFAVLAILALLAGGPAFGFDHEKCAKAIKKLEDYNDDLKKNITKMDKTLEQLLKKTKDKSLDLNDMKEIDKLLDDYFKVEKKFDKDEKKSDLLEKQVKKDCEL